MCNVCANQIEKSICGFKSLCNKKIGIDSSKIRSNKAQYHMVRHIGYSCYIEDY